jgi:acetate kinase
VSETILVVNAGSSSIKFQLFSVAPGDRLERHLKGQIESVGVKPHLIARGVGGETLVDETWPSAEVKGVPAALDKVVGFLRAPIGQLPTAIGHRVVHGGPDATRLGAYLSQLIAFSKSGPAWQTLHMRTPVLLPNSLKGGARFRAKEPRV